VMLQFSFELRDVRILGRMQYYLSCFPSHRDVSPSTVSPEISRHQKLQSQPWSSELHLPSILTLSQSKILASQVTSCAWASVRMRLTPSTRPPRTLRRNQPIQVSKTLNHCFFTSVQRDCSFLMYSSLAITPQDSETKVFTLQFDLPDLPDTSGRRYFLGYYVKGNSMFIHPCVISVHPKSGALHYPLPHMQRYGWS
jgi:hypothetical protein